MSHCSGCFPTFQPNQLAHMDTGGCMCQDEDFVLEPINLEPQFDAVLKKETSSNYVPQPAVGSECIICFETIGAKNNCVTDCGHSFCFKCLAQAMARSNQCPYCRQDLYDMPAESEDEEEDSASESDSEADSDDESIDWDAPAYLESEPFPSSAEELTERLVSAGFSTLDLVSMLTDRYSKTDPKYTYRHACDLYTKYDKIREDLDRECVEREQMGCEDLSSVVRSKDCCPDSVDD